MPSAGARIDGRGFDIVQRQIAQLAAAAQKLRQRNVLFAEFVGEYHAVVHQNGGTVAGGHQHAVAQLGDIIRLVDFFDHCFCKLLMAQLAVRRFVLIRWLRRLRAAVSAAGCAAVAAGYRLYDHLSVLRHRRDIFCAADLL